MCVVLVSIVLVLGVLFGVVLSGVRWCCSVFGLRWCVVGGVCCCGVCACGVACVCLCLFVCVV